MARGWSDKHKESVRRFDEWASTYETSFTWRWFFDPIHGALAREVGDVRGASILDMGCGTGDMLRRFSGGGGGRLVGVDASNGMLDVARELCRGRGDIELVKGSAESLPLGDREFDIVTSCIAFHHFPEPEGALSEMERVLKPGGRLYLCDMSGEGVAGWLMLTYGRLMAQDDHYFDRRSLSRMIADAGLEPGVSARVRFFPPAIMVAATKGGEGCSDPLRTGDER